MREISFRAEAGCAQIRKDSFTLLDLKFTADAKQGIVELKPLSTRLLGTPGQGQPPRRFQRRRGLVPDRLHADAVPDRGVLFSSMQLKKLAGGRMDFSATLTTRGTTLAELKQAMAGRVYRCAARG